MPNQLYLSQVTLPSGTYKLKDEEARQMIAGAITFVFVDTLPEPSAETMNKFYFVPAPLNNAGNTDDLCDEYVTKSTGDTTTPYRWEKVGSARINLEQYSLKTHKHNVQSNVSVGNHSYTPAGSVGVTVNSVESHTHTVAKSQKYLHKTSVPSEFNTASVPTSATTSKLVKTKIRGVAGTTKAHKATAGTPVAVAKVGTAVAVKNITSNGTGSVTVNLNNSNAGANSVMAVPVVTGETLSFNYVEITATTDATKTQLGTDLNITPAESNGTITPYSFEEVTVATAADNQTDVATGELGANGTGAQVATGITGAQTVLTGVKTNKDVFNEVDTTATNGEPVITAVGDNTGSGGGHSHNASGAFTGTQATLQHSVTNGTVETGTDNSYSGD